jgi:hypothetical protein
MLFGLLISHRNIRVASKYLPEMKSLRLFYGSKTGTSQT